MTGSGNLGFGNADSSGIPQTPPYSGGKISGSFPVKNFAETMEDLHRRKQQEEMAYEGKKLLNLLKVLHFPPPIKLTATI
jgi:hypothetical protein